MRSKVYVLRVYEAKDGWRWRLAARNGRIVADSAESYSRRGDACRAADRVAGARLVMLGAVGVAG